MNLVLNFPALMDSLGVMAEGMGGVFLVIAAIWVSVACLNRLTKQ